METSQVGVLVAIPVSGKQGISSRDARKNQVICNRLVVAVDELIFGVYFTRRHHVAMEQENKRGAEESGAGAVGYEMQGKKEWKKNMAIKDIAGVAEEKHEDGSSAEN